jgi:hypothetical protein
MYEIKTKKNDSPISKYLESIEDEKKRDGCTLIYTLMKKLTKEEASMYGDSIVGFCSYSYKSKSGCVGTWFKVGFSARKTGISIYVVPYIEEIEKLQKELGKAKCGKSCIVIKKIEDINLDILEKMITLGIEATSL